MLYPLSYRRRTLHPAGVSPPTPDATLRPTPVKNPRRARCSPSRCTPRTAAPRIHRVPRTEPRVSEPRRPVLPFMLRGPLTKRAARPLSGRPRLRSARILPERSRVCQNFRACRGRETRRSGQAPRSICRNRDTLVVGRDGVVGSVSRTKISTFAASPEAANPPVFVSTLAKTMPSGMGNA